MRADGFYLRSENDESSWLTTLDDPQRPYLSDEAKMKFDGSVLLVVLKNDTTGQFQVQHGGKVIYDGPEKDCPQYVLDLIDSFQLDPHQEPVLHCVEDVATPRCVTSGPYCIGAN